MAVEDGLSCEQCGGHWCDDCAERGPDKRHLVALKKDSGSFFGSPY